MYKAFDMKKKKKKVVNFPFSELERKIDFVFRAYMRCVFCLLCYFNPTFSPNFIPYAARLLETLNELHLRSSLQNKLSPKNYLKKNNHLQFKFLFFWNMNEMLNIYQEVFFFFFNLEFCSLCCTKCDWCYLIVCVIKVWNNICERIRTVRGVLFL